MKGKKTKTIIAILVAAVVLISAGAAILFSQSSGSNLMDTAAKRDGKPDPDVTYIQPDLTALTSELVGTAETKAAAKAAFDEINKEREAAGLHLYAWDSGLEEAAKVRAIEASENWSHTRPDGSEYWTVNPNIVYGENLAKGYQTAEEAVKAWFESPTHKANDLDSELCTAAISIHISNDRWYWANEFGY